MSGNHPDTVSESEAAEMLGWSPAALRSHRLRYEAQQTADALDPGLRELLSQWPSEETRVLSEEDAEALDGLVAEIQDGFALTRQGAEVARRVRRGHRTSPCAEPPPALRLGKPPRVRYDREAIVTWLRDHPEVARQDRLREKTIGQEETAQRLGISVGTLRGSRSRANRARARLEAGCPKPGDEREANASPPWVWVGSEKRYRPKDLERWIAQHGSTEDPLEIERRPRAKVIDDETLATLAGISPVVLPGYRSRARKAYRAMVKRDGEAEAQRTRDAGELAAPPHCRVDGQLRYHAADVRPWLKRRNSR